MLADRKILVIGGAGLVGSHVVYQLTKKRGKGNMDL
jgi:uncharacterized protein YbjT (DUF2867 family)